MAKTGNPNNPKTPNWPAYDVAKRSTMVFDNDTRAENDPRGDIRKFWDSMPMPASPLG
jgi:para-nitrobenzyl esterase